MRASYIPVERIRNRQYRNNGEVVLERERWVSLKERYANSHNKGDGGITLDPEIWCNLPDNIALSIYENLKLKDFFQLRRVCKSWNRIACERRCFKDPIPKPFFFAKFSRYTYGILTFNVSRGAWSWTRGTDFGYWDYGSDDDCGQSFTLEGLICNTRRSGRMSGMQVFDVHSKACYKIPLPPYEEQALGMVVDTSVRPYSFEIIQAGRYGTTIFKSTRGSWETTSSQPLINKNFFFPKSCVQIKPYVYSKVLPNVILVYNIEDSNWTYVKPPPFDIRGWGPLWTWQGHLFCLVCTSKVEQEVEEVTVTVFKLVDQSKNEWSEYDRMPRDWYRTWLRSEFGMQRTASSFSGEYLLVYTRIYSGSNFTQRGWAGGLCLYHMGTKRWEKVNLPEVSVRMTVER